MGPSAFPAGKGIDVAPPAALVRATEAAVFAVIGGESLTERHIDWNFVSSSKSRIEQAKTDWRERKFPLVPGDEKAYAPLPKPRER